MDIATSISARVSIVETVVNGLSTGNLPVSRSLDSNLGSGTGSGNNNLQFSKAYTLAAGAAVTLTLSALTDDLGRAVPFARVKVFLADNTATTADGYDLRVAAGATSGWTAPFDGTAGKFTAKAGGLAFLYAPLATAFPVGAGTSDQVTITNLGAGSVTFNIVISGVNT
jgi:hypothetical protein